MGFSPRRTVVWALTLWLVVAVPLSALAAMVYLTVQQNYRQNANDPQIQLARDAETKLTGGAPPEAVVPRDRLEISRSLSPFVAVLDERGTPLATSGLLFGQAPRFPPGVLEFARQHGEHRVSWQPGPGVRSALVVRHYGGGTAGFVASGRSLLEVEAREAQLQQIVRWVWAGGLVACGAACLLAGAILTLPRRPER